MKRGTVIFIIVLALIAAGGYFLYSQLIVGEIAPTPLATKVIETNFDTKIFSEATFAQLKQYVASPVEIGQEGKINPFMKF